MKEIYQVIAEVIATGVSEHEAYKPGLSEK